jgi:acetyl esterase/lipase
MKHVASTLLALLSIGTTTTAIAQNAPPIFVWPDLAPGETERATGTTLPMRPQDNPPITRVEKIRRPPMAVYQATKNANGAAVLILPGGGFGRVVPDLEGSEAAQWLGQLGVTSFVLNYRTRLESAKDEPAWRRPLQDAQRAIRWIRANGSRWNLRQDQIGLLAFSAGGQVGSILITADKAAYERIDSVDDQEFRPNFAMLVYPWRIYDSATDALLPQIKVSNKTPPSFIVHTHDDASTSLGSVLLYAAMKRNNVPAELHVYENGGHGYGTRDRPNSNIGSWSDRATDWLARKLPK